MHTHLSSRRVRRTRHFATLLALLLALAGCSTRESAGSAGETTDVDAFLAAADVFGSRLAAAGSQPPGTLLGVAKLAFPGLMIEIEATAAK